jgi:ABC-type Fe3+/spermidine/putrescine transport system ATPase subunit
MHEGRIHQVGPPAEVYERPATGFVADFVGESNTLAGTVEKVSPDGMSVRVQPGGYLVHGPDGRLEAGRRARVIIRPEALTIGAAVEAGENWIEAVVEEALYLGQAIRYAVRADDLTLIARVPRRTGERPIAVGATVRLSWPRGSTVILPEDDRR